MKNSVVVRLYLFLAKKRRGGGFNIARALHRIYCLILGSDVYCKPAKGLILPHPYGIFIHSNCKIGENVVVMQQVTLGIKDLQSNGVPHIGQGCYIGAGAKILGDVKIGQNVRVGANAVVTRDVPSNATVVGYNRVIEDSL